jgi:glutathione S-transferase
VLTLYHHLQSPCAAKVRTVLTEKGLAWDSRIVDIVAKENLRPEYLALHPKGLVPTLVDDGKVVIESTLVMEYLDTAYDTDSLKPDGAYAQTRMRMWTKWVDETLHPNWPGLAWLILIRPRWLERSPAEIEGLLAKLIDPARRERQKRMLAQGFTAPEFMNSMRTLDISLAEMEKALADHPWLAGDKPSLGDCAVLPYVAGAELFGLDMMLAPRPRVRAWLARWKARPAFTVTMPWTLDAPIVAETRRHAEPAWAALRAAWALNGGHS